MIEKILRQWTVCNITGLSRSSLYQQIKAEQFPRQISIGARSVGWLASDIETWIANRIAATDCHPTIANQVSANVQS